MMIRKFFLLLSLFAAPLVQGCSGGATVEDAEKVKTVQQFMDAYNEQDSAAMMRFADDGITWMMIDGENVTVVSRGKSALVDLLQGYFESIPSARSELLSATQSGSFVMTVEKATWKADDGSSREQCSTAVYEFRQGLIGDVWYFPPYPCPGS